MNREGASQVYPFAVLSAAVGLRIPWICPGTPQLIDGCEVPIFRGDNINSVDPSSRTHDPRRLVQGYHHSAAILRHCRALGSVEGCLSPGLATPSLWHLDHVEARGVAGARYQAAVARVLASPPLAPGAGAAGAGPGAGGVAAARDPATSVALSVAGAGTGFEGGPRTSGGTLPRCSDAPVCREVGQETRRGGDLGARVGEASAAPPVFTSHEVRAQEPSPPER